MKNTDHTMILREFDLFQDLNDEEMVFINQAAPMSKLATGQTLYSPLRPTEVLFILKSGRIRLYQIGTDGRTLTTAILEAGQVFGEMAALGQRLDQTYAETLEPCVVCLMSRADVERLLLSDARVATRIAEFLGGRIAELERRLGDSVLKHAPERICALLARLVRASGNDTIRLTHEQLADLAGTSRETVTKVLGELAGRRVVELKRGRIVVRDSSAVQQLAESGLAVITGG